MRIYKKSISLALLILFIFITLTQHSYADSNDVIWTTNQVLGQNGSCPFAGIYEFNNLTIGDNVEITSNGISQLVIKVNGTLTLGKNAVIRVRNGYYPGVPLNQISTLTNENINSLGVDSGGFRVYENIFGKGGDGGKGESSDYRYGGGGGGGGYGGGIGGNGGYGVNSGCNGKPGSNNGGGGGYGGANHNAGGQGGSNLDLGEDGVKNSSASSGGCGGGGGNGGNGPFTASYNNGASGGGGGGYGGGILTIIAKSIVYDHASPPKFIVSGQKGGEGVFRGQNGDSGLLIIQAEDYDALSNQWNLDSDTYGQHIVPSSNGGHGVVTGNPQKVFINGQEFIETTDIKINDSMVLYPGYKASLNPIIIPDNATNKNIIWSSSDDSIVKVEDDGVAEGIAAGSAIITAKTPNGLITKTCSVTVNPIVNDTVMWTTNQVLGRNGSCPFAGIYEFNNLTIGDNMEITSNGISQLVIKVNGTLTLGKNAVIRVRNGYYPDAPLNQISTLTNENINSLGVDAGGFRVYENMFGKGGDGGKGESSGYRYGGGGGGGGYGGGIGGNGGGGANSGCYGKPGSNNGGDGGYGGANYNAGGQGGSNLGLGKDGEKNSSASSGGCGGGGGNGGNGPFTASYDNGASGGGGGGYGGGILTIIARSIVYDHADPPKFLVSGQKGGSGIYSGQNGDGGLLIINSPNYDWSYNQWELSSDNYGQHISPSSDGGHGIVTGNPQKIFINGIEIVRVSGVQLDNHNADLVIGQSPCRLVADVEPDSAVNKNVTWHSDDQSIASVDNGLVTPVSPGTATISVTTEESRFTDTCQVHVLSDAECVAAAKEDLNIGDLSAVMNNLVLPAHGIDGTAISWSSDKLQYINNSGIITRPTLDEGDQTVTLTATITRGNSSDIKQFTATVKAPLDSECVAYEKDILDIGDLTAVTSNLTFPGTGEKGTTISWSSDKPQYITNDGKITKPFLIDGDQTVKLTAAIKKGSSSDLKIFTATVLTPRTDSECVETAKEALNLGDLTEVTGNLSLPGSGINGTLITWSSDNPKYITDDGIVTRPLYTESNQIARLTATITKGNTNDFKVFTATVLASGDLWKTSVVLGQNGSSAFAGVYEFDNLTIGDNVEVDSKGISQLVIKVKGTLRLGKNAVIRVRNGYYNDKPINLISSLNENNLNSIGIDGGNYRLYDNMFGKGGNGGNAGDGSKGYKTTYLGVDSVGDGGYGGYGGNGGYGGGLGGKGGNGGACGYGLIYEYKYGTWGYYYEFGKNGQAGSDGQNNAGSPINIGSSGVTGQIKSGGGGGSGNGGPGGNGGNGSSVLGDGQGGGGGGGGGYGGGILTIIADKIIYDPDNPPMFLVSGQKGGRGGNHYGKDGENGQGGLLVINANNFNALQSQWNLENSTYGVHTVPSTNGGHGVVTGDPQKVFINNFDVTDYTNDSNWNSELYNSLKLDLEDKPSMDLTGHIACPPLINGALTSCEGINVEIKELSVTTTSAIDGTFSFKNIQPGTYTLSLTGKNYKKETISNVTVTTGSSAYKDITMYLLGDVDTDGKVSENDYLLVKQYLLGTTSIINGAISLSLADFDEDGVITSRDIALILKSR